MHLLIASFRPATLALSLMIATVIADDSAPTQLANPASVNCQQQGGELSIRQRPDGGEYGVCVFEDNRQCEEWSLLRGECPVGGVKITGYDNESEIYCAITGGEVNMATKTCKTHQGILCDVAAYFSGLCPESTTPQRGIHSD
jgi:putative hemolysin